jgi:energy-coupling factor transport system ATP-binding protein
MSSLSLKNISVIYNENSSFSKKALDDINIDFPEGKIIGIIGKTGSGKSTLASLLNGLIKPTSGQVILDNKDIWEDPKKIRNVRFKVGLSFQYPEYQLFGETVREDISFGPKNMGLSEKEITDRVNKAASFCGIDPKIMKSSPFELSGGQRRRVAIAGIVAMDPSILVLDEPASGLDPVGREEILGGIVKNSKEKGTTTIIISHSMEDIAKYSDYILVLNQGKVFSFGTVEETFSEAEKLFSAGLDLPQVTKLFIELKKRGLCEEHSVYTVEYAYKKLLKILEK